MSHLCRKSITLAAAIAAMVLTSVSGAQMPPNPYRVVDGWAKLPDGRKWGPTSAVDVDRNGHIWVFERCGGRLCDTSKLDPIMEFDQSGRMVRSFGAGMFVFPHGIGLDNEGNVYVTDTGINKRGQGQTVVKFSPAGKVMLTLGKPGIAGNGPDTFNRPSDVAIAANGDIFVADGHGDGSNARIVKFSKDGKFIKTWGKQGAGPGEFALPHALAIDLQGRIFVADRDNLRIQIFDPDGKYLTEWKHFGRPSGLFIDTKDTLYVGDTLPDGKRVKGKVDGIWVASAKDGKVIAFIPEPGLAKDVSEAPEGVAADAMGNVYGAQSSSWNLRKYAKP